MDQIWCLSPGRQTQTQQSLQAMIGDLMRAGWAWSRAKADYHPREGTISDGFGRIHRSLPDRKGVERHFGQREELCQGSEADTA